MYGQPVAHHLHPRFSCWLCHTFNPESSVCPPLCWNRDCTHNQQKQQFDWSVKHIPCVSGDFVWLNDPTTSKQKLDLHWKGPFEILECLGSDDESPGVTYRIHSLLDHSDKSQIVHYYRLRSYNGPVPDRIHKTFTCDSSLQLQIPLLDCIVKSSNFLQINVLLIYLYIYL